MRKAEGHRTESGDAVEGDKKIEKNAKDGWMEYRIGVIYAV